MKLLTYKYGYVYKTTNLINGRIYIGQHKSNRFDPYYKGSGIKLWDKINKYGWENFSVEILKWASTPLELDKLEILYIKINNSTNPKIGYNLSTGGGLSEGGNHKGCKLNKDQLVKLSEAHKGQVPHNKDTNCYHDENKNYYFPKGVIPPSHLIEGRKPLGYKRKSAKGRDYQHNKGRIGYTNGEHMVFIKPGEPIPAGYTQGQTPSTIPTSNHRKGKKCYSNGYNCIWKNPNTDVIPEGYIQSTKKWKLEN